MGSGNQGNQGTDNVVCDSGFDGFARLIDIVVAPCNEDGVNFGVIGENMAVVCVE